MGERLLICELNYQTGDTPASKCLFGPLQGFTCQPAEAHLLHRTSDLYLCFMGLSLLTVLKQQPGNNIMKSVNTFNVETRRYGVAFIHQLAL